MVHEKSMVQNDALIYFLSLGSAVYFMQPATVDFWRACTNSSHIFRVLSENGGGGLITGLNVTHDMNEARYV